MRRFRILLSLASIAGLAFSLSAARSQQALQDEINPAQLRSSWILQSTGQAERQSVTPEISAPYILSKQDRDKFKGTFSLDLSHYDFDIGHRPPFEKCKTHSGYDNADCSCKIDWGALQANGLKYVYLKASDGDGIDLSFAKNWSDLEPLQQSKSLLRGAYHFLRPKIDGAEQANAFLKAIGATARTNQSQLPPVLDMEWSNRTVGNDNQTCPNNRRTTKNAIEYCDMWYQVGASDIAALAETWIRLVTEATGRPVIIYTNAGAWWDLYVGMKGTELIRKHAIWMSRYLPNGPAYDSRWTASGGSTKWKMPPLPKPGSYPSAAYSVANFWQFSENGGIKPNVLNCSGHSEFRTMDLSWIPVEGNELQALFGVK